MWWNTFKLGVKNLLLHKLRNTLTVLGVILGVASVITMLAIGEGSKRAALERIQQLGANNVIIRSVKPGQHGDSEDDNTSGSGREISRVLEYGLKYADYDRLLATLPTVTRAVPIALLRKDALHGGHHIPNARILGTTPEYVLVKNLRIRRGRFLTGLDVATTRNVAVLAAGAAKRLFSFEDPLDKPLLVGEDVYHVVGLLEPQATGTAVAGGVGQQDFNDDIYIPLTAVRQRLGEVNFVRSAGSFAFERTQLGEITLTVKDTSLVSQTAAMARKLLRRKHPDGTDFEVQVPLELLRQAEHEKRIWNLVLGSIAGISLVVGGIGIMNIMLAAVTERTREIGIRRALGAKQRDIIIQFLVETVVLSSTGGLLGILLGVSVPSVVSHYSEIETMISWWSIFLAFGISVGVGIVFGLYPARRAARMHPIEALRHQ